MRGAVRLCLSDCTIDRAAQGATSTAKTFGKNNREPRDAIEPGRRSSRCVRVDAWSCRAQVRFRTVNKSDSVRGCRTAVSPVSSVPVDAVSRVVPRERSEFPRVVQGLLKPSKRHAASRGPPVSFAALSRSNVSRLCRRWQPVIRVFSSPVESFASTHLLRGISLVLRAQESPPLEREQQSRTLYSVCQVCTFLFFRLRDATHCILSFVALHRRNHWTMTRGCSVPYSQLTISLLTLLSSQLSERKNIVCTEFGTDDSDYFYYASRKHSTVLKD